MTLDEGAPTNQLVPQEEMQIVLNVCHNQHCCHLYRVSLL
jgi:hypothetical protein